jgi:hypothetical protein
MTLEELASRSFATIVAGRRERALGEPFPT